MKRLRSFLDRMRAAVPTRRPLRALPCAVRDGRYAVLLAARPDPRRAACSRRHRPETRHDPGRVCGDAGGTGRHVEHGFQANMAMQAWTSRRPEAGAVRSATAVAPAMTRPASTTDFCTARLYFSADLHCHDGRRLASGKFSSAGVRNHEINEGFFVTVPPVCADPAGNDPAVAGRRRHQLRRRHRQGSLRRHRQELPEPRPRRPGFPVFRLSGADIG